MNWLSSHQTELISLLSVILTAAVTRFWRLKAILVFSVGHSWNMLVDQPLLDKTGKKLQDSQLVRTASINVVNSGLLPARSVEIAFNWKPPIYNINPARGHTAEVSAFGRYSLRFESLAPKEQITIEIMSINEDLPLISTVRSEDAVGKLVPMALQRTYPGWFNAAVAILLMLGCSTAVYLIFSNMLSVLRVLSK